MKGTIKFYNSSKSFGFIKVQGLKDVFFHKTSLARDYVPEDNDNVEFELRQTERGPSAENVVKD